MPKKILFIFMTAAFIIVQANSLKNTYSFQIVQKRAVNNFYDGSILISQNGGLKRSHCLAQCESNLYCSISVFHSNKTCKLYYQSVKSYLVNDSLSALYIINRTPLTTTTTTTTTTTSSTTTAQDNTNGLVNYWPVHNGDLNDHVGSGSASSVSSTVYVSNRLSVANDAAYIQSGYINIQTATYFSSNFTLMMWIQMIQLPNASIAIFDCGQGIYPNDDILLAIDQNGFLFTYIFSGTNAIGGANGIISQPLNTWIHVAFTWDGSIARIYVNGALGSNVGSIATSSPNSIPRNRCGFGLDYSSDSATLNAYLDEIRIYSRCLSSSEINTQYLVNL